MGLIKKEVGVLFILALFALTSIFIVSAQSNSSDVTVYFFWGDGCPHCAVEKPFLEELESKYSEVEVKMFETWKDSENAQLFREVAKAYDTTPRGVPTTFIGDEYWVGYADYMGDELEAKIQTCIATGCVSPYESSVQEQTGVTASDGMTSMPSQPSEQETTSTQDSTCVHIFVDENCDDCSAIKNYIDSLDEKKDEKNIQIVYHNIQNDSELQLYESFKEKYGIKTAGFPIVFIGNNYLIGQDGIRDNLDYAIEECIEDTCPCPAENIQGITPSLPQKDYKGESQEFIKLPFVGEVNVGKMPLVLMTSLIAFVDGFNPCSLWILTFLLGIVIYTGSRKKILLVGGTFLLVTAAAYGLFMLGLVNVFSYIGFSFWIKLVVSLIALLFAIVNIKDYFWYKKGISFTISDKYKPKIFKKVRNIMDPSRSVGSMLVATAIMALGIVLVELPCTAGFPMIWTNILAQNNVAGITFAFLLGIYLLIYLLDELVVFSAATITLRASKFEEKHGRILKLIGGVIMLALAIALVFFPDVMNSISGSLILFGIAIVFSYTIILLHRKILPRFGIRIGSEFKENKTLDDDQEDEK